MNESRAVFVSTDEAWLDGWRGPSVFEWNGASLDYRSPLASWSGGAPMRHLPGTVLPGFRDSHVHLGLVDANALAEGGLSRVQDLGWEPSEAARWAASPGALDIDIVGALLTVPDGYPSRSSWAPVGSWRFVATPQDASDAVSTMKEIGASAIKITLNSDAGPVLSFELLEAIVGITHAAGLPVVAHAQGVGQSLRAVRAGVDVLAHAPWSEPLGESELSQSAARCAWISTLDIHGWGRYGRDYEVAVRNLRRFAALGGRVLYGTDLGNGPLPLGLNPREIEGLLAAGLSLDAVIASLTPGSPSNSVGTRLSWIAGDRVARDAPARDVAAWISSAKAVSAGAIEEMYA